MPNCCTYIVHVCPVGVAAVGAARPCLFAQMHAAEEPPRVDSTMMAALTSSKH